MGYLRKDMVIDALREDVQVTKEMCYEGCTEKEIVKLSTIYGALRAGCECQQRQN